MAEQINSRIAAHGERLTRLEARVDNFDIMHNETKNKLNEISKEMKWQTKQIFMGIGGFAVIIWLLAHFTK